MFADFWESQTLIKTLYARSMEPVCKEYGLTRMELDILLFLANNPMFHTAADIVEKRRLTKSHVSVSVRTLEERGLLKKSYQQGNRKNIHLSLTEDAVPVTEAGRRAQMRFGSMAMDGFSEEELAQLKQMFCRINRNIHHCLGSNPDSDENGGA